MIRALLLMVFVIIFARPAAAPQTAHALAAKYPVVSYYEARPGVLMEPRYTADGQMCSFRLFAKQITPKMNNCDLRLRDKTVDAILDDLVAAKMRGQRAKDFGMMVTVGKLTTQPNNNENVSVEKMSAGDQGDRFCPDKKQNLRSGVNVAPGMPALATAVPVEVERGLQRIAAVWISPTPPQSPPAPPPPTHQPLHHLHAQSPPAPRPIETTSFIRHRVSARL
jgi:hypothetical protein